MAPRTLYRTAAIFILIFAAGHTGGFTRVDPAWGVDSLVESIHSTHFDAYGSDRTYWDFFLGFGFVVTALLVLAAVAAWQFSSLPAETLAKLRLTAWTFVACFAAVAVLAWRYFFIMPIVLSFGI